MGEWTHLCELISNACGRNYFGFVNDKKSRMLFKTELWQK